MLKLNLFVSACLVAMALPGIAAAQTATSEIEEVVVTASRIQRSGFNEPTPVTSLGSEDLQKRGVANVAEALTEIPAFRATVGQSLATNTNFLAIGGQNAVDLRGLGAVRSLTLVDGRRFVTSPFINAVNLNLIPTIAIERTEVVTGGASAAWGSDAVAGVVNLILNTRFNGLKAEVLHGQSRLGDDQQYKAALAFGTNFLSERGHLFAAFEVATQQGIGKAADKRDWGKRSYGIVSNPTPGVNGLPARIISPDVYVSTLTPGGLVFSGPLRGLEFLPGGATRQFNYGQVFGDAMIGGDFVEGGANANSLKVPADRASGLVHADLDLADGVQAFAEFSYAETSSTGRQGFSRDSGNGPRAITVRRDNPYLPPAVLARMVTLNLQTIVVGRYQTDLGEQGYDNKTEVRRGVFGAKGELGKNWNWDAYAQFGQNDLHAAQTNFKRTARGVLAADAVRDPATGQIVCRSTLTNPSNGCVPWNIFGEGATSGAARAYLIADGDFSMTSKQTVLAANLRGDLFSTWAGPVSVATGLEYRQEKVHATSDPISSANEFAVGNLQPIDGSYDVKEGYAEVVVPLAKDQPWAYSLELNAAARYAHYSNSGGVTTWKVGASYSPFEDLRFRATRSRDIRAPNSFELFLRPTVSSTSLVNRFTGTTGQIRTVAVGNPDLQPEVADTTTAGIVYQPSWLPGLRMSVDYFSIEIRDLIGPVGPQNIIDYCFNGVSQFCNFLTRNGTAITEVVNANVNTSSLETSGFDLEVAYQRRLFDGQLSMRLLGTHVRELTTNVDLPAGGVVSTDRAGQLGALGGQPDWVWTATTTYTRGPLSVTGQLRYIGSGVYDVTLIGPDDPRYSPALANSINDNTVPGAFYANLSAEYRIGDRWQVFGVVNNVFDKDPPYVPTTTYASNGAIYDMVGRAWRVGIRYGF